MAGVEIYLSRCLGFVLATLASVILLLTGVVPLDSLSEYVVANPLAQGGNPYAFPVVFIATLYHAVSLLYCYVRWLNATTGSTGYLLGTVGNGALAAVGLWCLVFGGVKARTSKRTGADKRTTGYPFKNDTAYDKKMDRKRFQ